MIKVPYFLSVSCCLLSNEYLLNCKVVKMDWNEIKFYVGLTIIFSFFLYVNFCDIVIISVTLFLYSFIANISSYFNFHEVNATTKEGLKEQTLENSKGNISPSNNLEPISGDFQFLSNFDNNSDVFSSCIAQCDENSLSERDLQDFEQSGDFSGNQEPVNNRWSRFKGRVRKYMCCFYCSEEKK